MRTLVRSTLLAGLTGTLMVSAAWAGIGISPVPTPSLPGVPASAPVAADPSGTATTQGAMALATSGSEGLLVGASKNSIEPDPARMTQRFPGARWEKDLNKCTRLNPDQLAAAFDNEIKNVGEHLASTGTPWPENPDCIYQGGYGLGPMFPVNAFDQEFGLWVRSIAIGDGANTFILSVVDGEGWLWDYKSKCTDCGAKQIGQALGADPQLAARGVTAASFALHATHSHTSPDFIGGWGFVPDWYMAQVTETIKATAHEAVLAMRPAALEFGSENARPYNSERRPTYRSAEEPDLNWIRAVAVGDAPVEAAGAPADETATKDHGKKASPSPEPSPSPTEAPAEVIATLGAFAAHPVTQDESKGMAHPDWVGMFEKRLETRFGGVGLHFMTGLGNVTGARSTTGVSLANLLPAVGNAQVADGSDVRFSQTMWRQPVTNAPLDALGTAGLFDRKFDVMPAKVSVSDGNPDWTPEPGLENSGCVSAGAQSVELPASVLKIGSDLIFTTGPGELFSNLTNTIKEKAPNQTVFPLAQTNDALGYMPQSFELNPVGQQGLGFGANGFVFVNYEDSYAIDRCVGDMALETTLRAMSALQ
ncbi:MAG: hypothetical protein JJD92_07300 [Frankiaceae bacterium]|nr:hypothetical protein [Frankiaceae bacterium]